MDKRLLSYVKEVYDKDWENLNTLTYFKSVAEVDISYMNKTLALHFMASVKQMPLPAVHVTLGIIPNYFKNKKTIKEMLNYIDFHFNDVVGLFLKNNLNFIPGYPESKAICKHWFAFLPIDFQELYKNKK